jgi:hypothetical protein
MKPAERLLVGNRGGLEIRGCDQGGVMADIPDSFGSFPGTYA